MEPKDFYANSLDSSASVDSEHLASNSLADRIRSVTQKPLILKRGFPDLPEVEGAIKIGIWLTRSSSPDQKHSGNERIKISFWRELNELHFPSLFIPLKNNP